MPITYWWQLTYVKCFARHINSLLQQLISLRITFENSIIFFRQWHRTCDVTRCGCKSIISQPPPRQLCVPLVRLMNKNFKFRRLIFGPRTNLKKCHVGRHVSRRRRRRRKSPLNIAQRIKFTLHPAQREKFPYANNVQQGRRRTAEPRKPTKSIQMSLLTKRYAEYPPTDSHSRTPTPLRWTFSKLTRFLFDLWNELNIISSHNIGWAIYWYVFKNAIKWAYIDIFY